MANGAPVFTGNSKLLAGPLGVVKVFFSGYDLGKTVADAVLTPAKNEKEILYQQDGTMKADSVRTGQMYQLSATFGEISTGLLAVLMAGFLNPNSDANNDAGVLDRRMYESMRENEAGPLRIASVNSNGEASELDENILSFYEAVPMVDADLINWGANSQRELAVTFDIYWHTFDTGESSTYTGAFGYYGDPTAMDLPAIPWPDRFGPQLSSAEATAATTVVLDFDEVLNLVAGADLTTAITVKVNENFVVPSSAVIGTSPNDDKITLTLPASSIAAGDAVEVYVGAGCVEDSEATPNPNAAIDAYTVINSVP